MGEPVGSPEDTLPQPDDVRLTEDQPLPDVIEDVAEPEDESVEVADVSDFDDVDALPDIPGG